MGKINLPYVQAVVAKGKTYYRYRRKGLPKPIRLPDDPTSTEFAEAYNRINDSFKRKDETAGLIIPGSIAELVVAYKKSGEYFELSKRTKELYNYFLDDITDTLGRFPTKGMTRNVALEYRDGYGETPGKANNATKILGRLFSFALDRNKIKFNPLASLKKLKMGEYRPWTAEEIERFYTAAPNHIRIALALALYTGQRQGDILKMLWSKVADGGIHVKQQKTNVELFIPMHWRLREELNQTRKIHAANKVIPATIVATRNGRPYLKRWFNEEWNRVADAVKLPDDCVFHGLRKSALTFLAEAGCTPEQIQAIGGHATLRMVEHYTKKANQKKLAEAAIGMWEGKRRG